MSTKKDIPPQERTNATRGAQSSFKPDQLVLQQCANCATYLYPPREVCSECLHDNLPWRPAPNSGVLMAKTMLHHSNVAYFSKRLPWEIGMIKLSIGPTVIAHIKDDNLEAGSAVKVITQLDEGGQVIFNAIADD